MANQIVTVNVTQTVAPAPSTLQRTGAIVTCGGSTSAVGELELLTSAADLTDITPTPKTISTIAWSGGVVTVATATAHGLVAGVRVTIAGCTPAGYNGTYTVASAADSTHFTYALVSDPGSSTVQGTATPAAVGILANQVDTFFAQGANVSVYVLNLGVETPADGIGDLDDFITANPQTVYSFLLPDDWDGESTLITTMAGYETTTSKTYFFIRTTLDNYTDYADKKCAFVMVNSPDAPSTEDAIAAAFWKTLSINPSSTNQVAPLAFSYLYDVTAYPTFGNNTVLQQLKDANVNYVGTGAEGGLSNTILFWGHLQDGHPWNYWYSVDWVQINTDQSVATAVIQGSNNPQAPLYYNQDGINRLQAVVQRTMNQAVSYGLAVGNVILTQLTQAEFAARFNDGEYLGKVAINAVPFSSYTASNPSDYSLSTYSGLSVVFAPQLGFEQIIININATEVV